MHQKIKNIINNYKDEETTLNKIIVSIFIKVNKIEVKKNDLIKSLLISKNSNLSQVIDEIDFAFNFDDLIEGFELAIPSSEKTTNGAVYTPTYIKNFIVDNSFDKISKPYQELLTGDVSCGCGAFLFTIVNKLKLETNKSFYDIFRDNIFGLDISKSSIERARILLSLLAIYYREDVEEFDFNLYISNALSFDWNSIEKIKFNKGFDLIVGNPPYVRAKNIDIDSKVLLKNWAVTKSGNPDLYIPFFEIGLKNLNEKGVLGYITVNSFYKSVNARELRKYLKEKEYKIEIIDFGNEKIFIGKSAYTCICFISKEKSKSIYFKKETGKSLINKVENQFNKIPYIDLDFHKGWLLNDTAIIKNIKKIESAGKSLGDKYVIKNGIATLKNDIYIFKPIEEKNDSYILIQNGIKFEIEKAICKDIIKPNILKYEHEIESIKEKLIYPYTNGISLFSIMTEEYLSNNFPKAYKYLLFNKKDLEKRDKGEGNYCAWYAFGRTQALADKGLKLLFPYMGKKPHFVFTDQKDMLLYCGYAIFNESSEDLKILKRILESKVFEYYIKNTSKPYSGGYFSYAKNYVKNFGICDLNDNEKHFLSNGSTKDEINDFLIKKYNLVI
jgi:methylase of polypeptide subunit release factors